MILKMERNVTYSFFIFIIPFIKKKIGKQIILFFFWFGDTYNIYVIKVEKNVLIFLGDFYFSFCMVKLKGKKKMFLIILEVCYFFYIERMNVIYIYIWRRFLMFVNLFFPGKKFAQLY